MSHLLDQLRQQTQIAWESPELMDAFAQFESLMLEAARKGSWSMQHHVAHEATARAIAARLLFQGFKVELRRPGKLGSAIFVRVSWFPGAQP